MPGCIAISGDHSVQLQDRVSLLAWLPNILYASTATRMGKTLKRQSDGKLWMPQCRQFRILSLRVASSKPFLGLSGIANILREWWYSCIRTARTVVNISTAESQNSLGITMSCCHHDKPQDSAGPELDIHSGANQTRCTSDGRPGSLNSDLWRLSSKACSCTLNLSDPQISPIFLH